LELDLMGDPISQNNQSMPNLPEKTILIAYYNAARAEIVQRITLRETVALASVTASAAIAGIAFKASTGSTRLRYS
jgi:hypothetical protein